MKNKLDNLNAWIPIICIILGFVICFVWVKTQYYDVPIVKYVEKSE